MCSKKPIKALGGGISNPTLCTLKQLTARKKDSEDKTKTKQTSKQKKKSDFFIQTNQNICSNNMGLFQSQNSLIE